MPRNNGRHRKQWRQGRAKERNYFSNLWMEHWNRLMNERHAKRIIGGLADEHQRCVQTDSRWVPRHERRWLNAPRPN